MLEAATGAAFPTTSWLTTHPHDRLNSAAGECRPWRGLGVTFRIMCRISSGLLSIRQECADDEALLGSHDQFSRQVSHVIDLGYAFDLCEQTLDQSEVATGDAHDAAEDARVNPVVQFESQTELERLSSDDALQLGSAQRQELVDEPDARIQLGVSPQALLKTRHADQHQADMATVIQIAQLLEPSRPESIGFINNDEIGPWPPGRAPIVVPVSRTPPRVNNDRG